MFSIAGSSLRFEEVPVHQPFPLARRYTLLPLLLLTVLGSSSQPVLSQSPADHTRGARINNLKVLSDRVDDVTTAENILKSFVKPGTTDEQRAKALWTAAVRYRHQTAPPNEYLSDEWETHDPVKI